MRQPKLPTVPDPPASLPVSREEIARLSEEDRATLRRYYIPSGKINHSCFVVDCAAVWKVLEREGK